MIRNWEGAYDGASSFQTKKHIRKFRQRFWGRDEHLPILSDMLFFAIFGLHLFPGFRAEQNQHGKDFQSADHHGQGQNDF